ncbi:uncharacterized protein N7496_008619 [Penicillium cataractarum]|uniref:DUF676 domain-containing protein n=1 Tax=Penicillium cataractarum TaxID=2100454 RepID=A0A9W9V5X4_9EURO|nr:uncharacterized protein N7496_008619 [Penicillium cataractarum]KAJ5368859.1 hypothetical protein N7496_008619 [Penicillium cataractarum]
MSPSIGSGQHGAHHLKTWTSPGSSSPWLRTELVARIPKARVLLYNHGQLQENTTILPLGQRLLNALLDERKHERSRRPLFFICHSTGGLVAKVCLALASRAEPTQAILTSYYGIAFFATPHQGSSYLSADEYASSIYHLLHLEQDIPVSLREQFRPRQERLWHLSNQLKALSADLKVWSFLETVDSTMTAVDPDTGRLIEILAPISSIRSGILGGMGNENQIAMATDHVGTASFHGQELALDSFLTELADAAREAVELSSLSDTPLDLERKVMVQVHGFFEDPAFGISDDTPLKLWTASVSLEEYLNRGPAACLRDQLNRDQPTGPDDSSMSRVSNPQHQLSHIIPGPKEHGDDYHESQRKNESGP